MLNLQQLTKLAQLTNREIVIENDEVGISYGGEWMFIWFKRYENDLIFSHQYNRTTGKTRKGFSFGFDVQTRMKNKLERLEAKAEKGAPIKGGDMCDVKPENCYLSKEATVFLKTLIALADGDGFTIVSAEEISNELGLSNADFVKMQIELGRYGFTTYTLGSGLQFTERGVAYLRHRDDVAALRTLRRSLERKFLADNGITAPLTSDFEAAREYAEAILLPVAEARRTSAKVEPVIDESELTDADGEVLAVVAEKCAHVVGVAVEVFEIAVELGEGQGSLDYMNKNKAFAKLERLSFIELSFSGGSWFVELTEAGLVALAKIATELENQNESDELEVLAVLASQDTLFYFSDIKKHLALAVEPIGFARTVAALQRLLVKEHAQRIEASDMPERPLNEGGQYATTASGNARADHAKHEALAPRKQ